MPNPEDFIEVGRLEDGHEHQDTSSNEDYESSLDNVIAETQSELIDTLDDVVSDEDYESNLDDVISETEVEVSDTLDTEFDMDDHSSDAAGDSDVDFEAEVSDGY
jgi:hypothetical protein